MSWPVCSSTCVLLPRTAHRRGSGCLTLVEILEVDRMLVKGYGGFFLKDVLRRMLEVLWEVRRSPKGSGRVTALAPASSIPTVVRLLAATDPAWPT